MRKHKILIAALAMAVMLTGAGYAYWTQSLTISNTVNTGNMDVGFVCKGDADWDDGFISGNHSSLVTVDAVRAADKQSMTFKIGNFYPGAGASLDFVVKNTGTVAAKISQVVSSNITNPDLCNALNYEFKKVKVYRNGIFQREVIINESADTVAQLASGLSGALDDIIIQPGELLVLEADRIIGPDDKQSPGYNILMPATIEGNQYENQAASFKLALNFTQVN